MQTVLHTVTGWDTYRDPEAAGFAQEDADGALQNERRRQVGAEGAEEHCEDGALHGALHGVLQSALHSALHGALHGAVHGALHKCTCEEVVRVDAPREIGDAALSGIYTVAAWGTTVAGALAFGCRPGADQEARCRIGGQV